MSDSKLLTWLRESIAGMRCSGCHAAVNPFDSLWRWDGEHWEHRCAENHPQVGCLRAERKPEFAEEAKK
jgi:hypothetical protein